MHALLALALITVGGLMCFRTWLGLVPAVAGAVIVPLHYALAFLIIAALIAVMIFVSAE